MSRTISILMQGTKSTVFSQTFFCHKLKILIVFSMEEINPVVIERLKFQKRDFSKLIATFLHYRSVTFLTQGRTKFFSLVKPCTCEMISFET